MRMLRPCSALIFLALIAGCNSGSVSGPTINTGTAPPTLPASSSASVTVGPAPASATFAPIAGLALTAGFPATTGGFGSASGSALRRSPH